MFFYPESWCNKLSIKQLRKKNSRTTSHEQDQEYNFFFFFLGPFYYSFCKFPYLQYFIKWQQKTTAGQALYRPLLAEKKKKKLDVRLREAIPLNKLLTFGHYPKGERGGPTRIQKFWGSFLGLFYITRSCITCMNKSKADGSFVSRSWSRNQILEQEPYLGEYAPFTLTHIAGIMQL